MSNQQLIKSAHVWFLTGLLACGLMVIAGKAGIRIQEQNSNQNSNSNSNTGNANRSQNRNANRSANRNSDNMNSGNMNSGNMNATGGHTGMAGMSSRDRDFIMDAAMGGLMEVELGRVAAQQGSSEAVKQFGQRMVDDHSKANTELMTLASSKGITLPTSIDDKHRGEVTKLSAMTGADFDRAYSKMMLKDHEKDVSEFEKESTKGGDADIKAFATSTLPTLQEHLQLARALPGNERASSGGNSNSGGGSRNSNSNSGGGSRNSNSNRNRNGNMNGNSNNSNRP
jgi:putative membrane protein